MVLMKSTIGIDDHIFLPSQDLRAWPRSAAERKNSTQSHGISSFTN